MFLGKTAALCFLVWETVLLKACDYIPEPILGVPCQSEMALTPVLWHHSSP